MVIPAGFTLHETDLASGGVTVMKVLRTFSVASDLRFEVVGCPPVGSVLVFDRSGDGRELVHLAAETATRPKRGSPGTAIRTPCSTGCGARSRSRARGRAA